MMNRSVPSALAAASMLGQNMLPSLSIRPTGRRSQGLGGSTTGLSKSDIAAAIVVASRRFSLAEEPSRITSVGSVGSPRIQAASLLVSRSADRATQTARHAAGLLTFRQETTPRLPLASTSP